MRGACHSSFALLQSYWTDCQNLRKIHFCVRVLAKRNAGFMVCTFMLTVHLKQIFFCWMNQWMNERSDCIVYVFTTSILCDERKSKTQNVKVFVKSEVEMEHTLRVFIYVKWCCQMCRKYGRIDLRSDISMRNDNNNIFVILLKPTSTFQFQLLKLHRN